MSNNNTTGHEDINFYNSMNDREIDLALNWDGSSLKVDGGIHANYPSPYEQYAKAITDTWRIPMPYEVVDTPYKVPHTPSGSTITISKQPQVGTSANSLKVATYKEPTSEELKAQVELFPEIYVKFHKLQAKWPHSILSLNIKPILSGSMESDDFGTVFQFSNLAQLNLLLGVYLNS